MRLQPTTFIFTFVLSITLSGCLGKVKYPTYYAMQLPPIAAEAPIKTANASLAIREFRSPEYLRRGPIVYRSSPEEIGFYEYHRWATEPPKVVTESVLSYLEAKGRFTHVKIFDGRSNVDYLLSGRLEKLDEVDYDDGVKVEVALSAQLTDAKSGKTVWENSAVETTPVRRRDVSAIVSSMSQAMDRAITKLLSSLPADPATEGGS